jgi:2-phosphosulfolactate phosphatase
VEDLVGAGAVLHALGGRPSPEASAAVAAFLEAAADLPLAAEHDVSRVVPRLAGGAFAQVSWPG